jgi:hypothetical protein
VIVAGDIAAGDEVVTEGLQRLREGASVSRVEAADGSSVDAAPPAGTAGAGRRVPAGVPPQRPGAG